MGNPAEEGARWPKPSLEIRWHFGALSAGLDCVVPEPLAVAVARIVAYFPVYLFGGASMENLSALLTSGNKAATLLESAGYLSLLFWPF